MCHGFDEEFKSEPVRHKAWASFLEKSKKVAKIFTISKLELIVNIKKEWYTMYLPKKILNEIYLIFKSFCNFII